MNKDKALIRTLNRRSDELSGGFEERLMNRILQEAEKKSRRDYLLGLLLAGAVSLAMVAGAVFVFVYYFSFDLRDLFSGIRIRFEYSSLYTYCFYIAFLVLVLLGLDYKFRKIMKKTGYE